MAGPGEGHGQSEFASEFSRRGNGSVSENTRKQVGIPWAFRKHCGSVHDVSLPFGFVELNRI